jgi:hypothetical protein
MFEKLALTVDNAVKLAKEYPIEGGRLKVGDRNL